MKLHFEPTAAFLRNPQQFIELAGEAINRTKRLAIVDGIRYQRVGDDAYYAQELFEMEELTGYLRNILTSEKSVYEHVVYDSAGVERSFASQLEKNDAVKVYAKLPGWFKVPTPLGTYNPDWAVLIERLKPPPDDHRDGARRVRFIRLTDAAGPRCTTVSIVVSFGSSAESGSAVRAEGAARGKRKGLRGRAGPGPGGDSEP